MKEKLKMLMLINKLAETERELCQHIWNNRIEGNCFDKLLDIYDEDKSDIQRLCNKFEKELNKYM